MRLATALLVWFTAISGVMHVVGMAVLGFYEPEPERQHDRISIRVVEVPKAAPPPPPPPPPAPKPQPKAVPEPKAQPVPMMAPIQGVSADSTDSGGNFAVPVGNTLMAPDEGLRLDPDAVLPTGDLSAEAKLIQGSIRKPPYTPEAQDVALEGDFLLDVFVSADGTVEEAELVDSVGYGMDDLLVKAALGARYEPRRDKFGKKISGWTTMTFELRLE